MTSTDTPPRNATSNLSIAYQPTSELRAYARNARTHSNGQVRQIASSIEAFGFTNPILVDKSNTIIAGHGRLSAAQLLGIARVPTIRLEGLSEDQIRAYVLADNKLAEKAGWDESILAIELQHLMTVDLGFEVTVTGFEVPEIDLLVGHAVTELNTDDEPELATSGPPVSQPGDRWMLGKHRILCADALLEKSFTTLMEGRKADAVFVDPPYNAAIDGHVSGNGSIRHREFEMASGEMSEGEFVQFLSTAFGLLSRYSKAGSVHFACMDWRMPENFWLPAGALMGVADLRDAVVCGVDHLPCHFVFRACLAVDLGDAVEFCMADRGGECTRTVVLLRPAPPLSLVREGDPSWRHPGSLGAILRTNSRLKMPESPAFAE
jgi:hypothetical protein